ncbi:expressed unknown protein [Seminavis robusta]|uniref:Uncharacterized protein n=1 Tax=Seminavis robusta TaxID=568900 RepID=A0A9N8H6Z6_9STRA|nr:expressed unknown protein [Seminavis robusta]|eukprot:Sro56_g033000.1 n/a (527) ;mRNA; f:125211-126791
MTWGPTMIIDRCASAHKLVPAPVWDSPSGSSVRSRQQDRDDGVGLDLDGGGADEEAAFIPKPSSSVHSLSSLIIPPSQVSLLHPHQQPQQQQQRQQQQQYGSIRLRSNNNNSPTTCTTTAKPPSKSRNSIRFQVVIWDVGPVDVALGRVPMTFRVTMFWDDVDEESVTNNNNKEESSIQAAEATTNSYHTEWTMQGRRKAYERLVQDENILKTVDVPAVSLINVVTFDIIGHPEICTLREQQRIGTVQQRRRLMRWTCLYKATLMQHHMRLDNFPHDEHVLTLKLGILVHRRPGSRWDINKYKLELATEDDSQYSTRIPHGLIVDHARVPDFIREDSLEFQFVPETSGASLPLVNSSERAPGKPQQRQQDSCLEVRLRVKRDSGYYDKNIMPLIGVLNVVAVTIPLSLECTHFFQRGLMLLNITFVQIGIRMNVDKHLPSVGYQIKMQRIMNQFFFSLLALVLESSLVYVLHDQYNWSFTATHLIDNIAAGVSFSHILSTWLYYYYAHVIQCTGMRSRARQAPKTV